MSEISQKQLEANRENAKLGGVKTEEGKAISKYNALKHGLLSQEVLLDDDDENTLIELGKRIRGELKPAGEIEMLLADRIVANMWRLKRVLEVERNLMEWQKNHEEIEFFEDKGEDQKKRKRIKSMVVNHDMEKLLRYETTIERGIFKALHELQRIQSVRSGNRVPAPVAVDVDVSKE